MSTSYVCLATPEGDKIVLHERSGRFDVSTEPSKLLFQSMQDEVTVNNLSAQEVARMAIRILKAVSYNDEAALRRVADEERISWEIGVKL
jgi:hypothetical protein